MVKRVDFYVILLMPALLVGCLDEGAGNFSDQDVPEDEWQGETTVYDEQGIELYETGNMKIFTDFDEDSDKDGTGTGIDDNWSPEFDLDPGPDESEETWTIMMYESADNNLETVLLNDINEMEASDIPSNVNIIVLVDRSAWYDSSDGNWSGAKLFKLVHDDIPKQINSIRLADPDFLNLSGTSKNGEELDMGSRETLDAFIQYCQTNFPAEHYILHISDHGDGWRYQHGIVQDPAPDRAISTDDSSGNALTVSYDLPTALEGKGVEAISFDACLMGTVEVAWALAPHVDYAAMSVMNVPSAGWQYTDVLDSWFQHMSAKNWTLNAVGVYRTYYQEHNDVGFTAVDLRAMEQFGRALDDFVASAANAPVDDLRIIRNRTYRPDPMSAVAMRDITDFVRRCESLVGQEKVEDVLGAYEDTILSYWYTPSLRELKGLSIYAPGPAFVQGGPYSSAYNVTPFARDTRWDEFILSIL